MTSNNTLLNRICLFGGTFDPIHKGHIAMANKVMELYDFGKVIFLPTGNSYLKTNVTNASKRCEMVELSITDNSAFEISYFEAQNDNPSYTYITLEHFKEHNPESELYYLIGEDSLRYIENWKRSDIIFKLAHLLVAKRSGQLVSADNTTTDSYNNSVEEVARILSEKYNAKIEIFDFNIDISSTMIRNAFKIHQESDIKDMLSSNVFDYISQNRLYEQ